MMATEIEKEIMFDLSVMGPKIAELDVQTLLHGYLNRLSKPCQLWVCLLLRGFDTEKSMELFGEVFGDVTEQEYNEIASNTSKMNDEVLKEFIIIRNEFNEMFALAQISAALLNAKLPYCHAVTLAQLRKVLLEHESYEALEEIKHIKGIQ